MITAGSIVTLSITSVITTDTADSIVQQVSSALANDGRLSVVGSPVVGGSLLNAALGALESLSLNQPFQVSMQVLTNTDFSGTNDPLSIVENEFYTATGTYPTAASTISVQAPGAAGIPTEQPGATPQGIGGSSASASPSAVVGSGISDAIAKFFAQLTSSAKSLLIGLAAILILVLVLIAYGPNVGNAASRI